MPRALQKLLVVVVVVMGWGSMVEWFRPILVFSLSLSQAEQINITRKVQNLSMINIDELALLFLRKIELSHMVAIYFLID